MKRSILLILLSLCFEIIHAQDKMKADFFIGVGTDYNLEYKNLNNNTLSKYAFLASAINYKTFTFQYMIRSDNVSKIEIDKNWYKNNSFIGIDYDFIKTSTVYWGKDFSFNEKSMFEISIGYWKDFDNKGKNGIFVTLILQYKIN